MSNPSVRYIVDDLDLAVDFYTAHLGFRVQVSPALGFAMLERDGLRLLLNTPGGGGGGTAMPDGSLPEPGGWNRFQLEVEDLEATVEQLRENGATFRGEIGTGAGGKHILVQDPARNLIELFEPWPTHAHTPKSE